MKKSPIVVLVLMLAAPLLVCARYQPAPQVKIEKILERSFPGPVPPLSSIPAPESPALVAQTNSRIPLSLLAGLPAVKNRADRDIVQKHLPHIQLGSLREITFERGDQILASITADPNKLITSVEFFSDDAFRGDALYFMSRTTIQALFTKYTVPVLTPVSGHTTDDGLAFWIEGLVMGQRHIYVFYNRGSANSRLLMRNTALECDFSVTDTVDQIIDPAPDTLSIPDILIPWGSRISAKLKRVTKVQSYPNGSADVKVETNYKNVTKRVDPITRK